MIAGLSLWVIGRLFEELEDYWDGNSLRVLVRCAADGTRVEVGGAILYAHELARWLDQLRSCYNSLTGIAELARLEPYLSARVSLNEGRRELTVDITPDLLNQKHRFIFQIDPSYLPQLMDGLERTIARYPIRGAK